MSNAKCKEKHLRTIHREFSPQCSEVHRHRHHHHPVTNIVVRSLTMAKQVNGNVPTGDLLVLIQHSWKPVHSARLGEVWRLDPRKKTIPEFLLSWVEVGGQFQFPNIFEVVRLSSKNFRRLLGGQWNFSDYFPMIAQDMYIYSLYNLHR